MKLTEEAVQVENTNMKDIISMMPKSKEELKMVSGIGEVKANKYGDDILEIANRY